MKVLSHSPMIGDPEYRVAVRFSSIGSYPLMYLMSGHTCMCPDCALEREGQHKDIQVFCHFEGQLSCEICEEVFDGAYYEEPEEEEEDSEDPLYSRDLSKDWQNHI